MAVHKLKNLETILNSKKNEILVVRKSGVIELLMQCSHCSDLIVSDRTAELFYVRPIDLAYIKSGKIIIPADKYIALEFRYFFGDCKLKKMSVESGNLELSKNYFNNDGHFYSKGGIIIDENVEFYFLHMAMQGNQICDWYATKEFLEKVKKSGGRMAESMKKTYYPKCLELLDKN